eukprot:976440-Rhodomonas_salina.1
MCANLLLCCDCNGRATAEIFLVLAPDAGLCSEEWHRRARMISVWFSIFAVVGWFVAVSAKLYAPTAHRAELAYPSPPPPLRFENVSFALFPDNLYLRGGQ